MVKRFVAVLLSMALAMGMLTQVLGAPAGEVFTGSARGYGGTLVVEVVVDGDEILSIEVVQHNETLLFYELPFERVISAALNDGNLNVDNVAGATITTMAVRAALMEALTAAGIDTRAMMTPTTAPTPASHTLEADIVVLGGGGAGLVAAIQASQLGASVIVVETLSFLGGNTLTAGNNMSVGGSRQLEALGIEDSPDLHFQNIIDAGDGASRPELVRVMVDNALDTMYWLEDIGVVWWDRINAPRGHGAYPGRNSQGWLIAFSEFVNNPANNVEVLLDTNATEIIMENGRATGVVATNRLGDEFVISGTKGVILATGGFSANVDMRMHYDAQWDGRLDRTVPHSNQPSAQGDGIRMAQAIGANVVDMGYIQLMSGSPLNGTIFNSAGGGGFMVNEQGQRFVAENASRINMTRAMFEQSNNMAFMLTDSRGASADADHLVEYGFAFRGETIEELAAAAGIDAEALLATISEFDELLASEAVCPFGRNFGTMRTGAIDLNSGPFYATPRVPSVHHTMGGVEIDTNARVYDVNGNIIAGLFAAGEVVGGVHGTNRMAGNAITEAFVFGRIAGESAVNGDASGRYSATGRGFVGPLTVEVEFDGERILSVDVTDHMETWGFADFAIPAVTQSIVEHQSVNVDIVTGATMTSRTIMFLVTQILMDAGATMAPFMQAPDIPQAPDRTYSTDIIIVGGGLAGLTAAVAAQQEGVRDIILIEKMGMPGGNTIRSSGSFNRVQSAEMAANNQGRSFDEWIAFTMTGGHYLNDEELVRHMFAYSRHMVYWLEDLGFVSVGNFVEGVASGMIMGLLDIFLDGGGTFYIDTKATEIIMDGGAAVGIAATGPTGEAVTFYADAIIMASGGFGADLDLIAALDPSLTGFITNNSPGATPEGIFMIEDIGGVLVHMEYIQTHPSVNPRTTEMITEAARNQGGILLNDSGRRFTGEVGFRDLVTAAILDQIADQEADHVYIVIDQRIVDGNVNIAAYYVRGIITRADTFADLAAYIGVDEGVIQEEMDKWNAIVADAYDPLGSNFDFRNGDLSNGPWYITSVAPGIHHTMGGAIISVDAEVLDASGNPIPGLFAAGEITGGIHGANRVGGNALTDCLVFGYTAARSAAAFVQQ